jgi:two-component system chemotaxis response regulator CheY
MTTKILIVDDASFIREILKAIAKRQGWSSIGEAEDGEEAVKMALNWRPDVILMDIVMPKLNGIDAGKQILKKYPGLPIIALSTVDKEELMTKAIETGFVSYIIKPFENWAIVTAVNEAIGTKEKVSG